MSPPTASFFVFRASPPFRVLYVTLRSSVNSTRSSVHPHLILLRYEQDVLELVTRGLTSTSSSASSSSSRFRAYPDALHRHQPGRRPASLPPQHFEPRPRHLLRPVRFETTRACCTYAVTRAQLYTLYSRGCAFGASPYIRNVSISMRYSSRATAFFICVRTGVFFFFKVQKEGR